MTAASIYTSGPSPLQEPAGVSAIDLSLTNPHLTGLALQQFLADGDFVVDHKSDF